MDAEFHIFLILGSHLGISSRAVGTQLLLTGVKGAPDMLGAVGQPGGHLED